MRYSFSAEFLRVLPPDTTFGNAWESLCFELLAAEHGLDGLQRLNAPDSGIDILRRPTDTAFQCKSDERGSFGSLSAAESIKSLRAAVDARPEIAWQCYTYATNANYTGGAIKSILAEATALDITNDKIEFLGPEHWDAMCSKHFARVKDRFDFRVTVTEAQVVEAFRKAQYFDEYVNKFAGLISNGNLVLKIKNNWTPVELEIPFAPDLTVENCVDAVQELLGVSLKWTNFADLGTSTGPSISLTIDRRGQAFKQTIGEVQAANGDKDLVFWITLVWKDETQSNGLAHDVQCRRMNLSFLTLDRSAFTEVDRRKHTLQRAERMVQAMIWDSARKLKNPAASVGSA
ncbi:MAG: hypothetical protein WBW48_09290 [Anaerolineae bacterium]